ncbi:hypothetical protein GWI34_04035, partial [Actinomadura sp. DSM 109109]|nr:hypothetical protein [Actinomadura lepetitiana]
MPTTHPRRAAHRRALFAPPDRPEAGRGRAVGGIVLDASPHLLVLAEAGLRGAETRIAMSEDTAIWHGGRGGPAALRPGRPVVVRRTGAGRADRVWVGIGRVSGTILARGRDTVEVDMGPHRGRAHVVVPPSVLSPVLVRHPRLEPGYLIDVICVGTPGGPQAVRPGTSQPGYRVADLAAPVAAAPVPREPRGTATWFGGVEGEWR